jgi:hypothetical protein
MMMYTENPGYGIKSLHSVEALPITTWHQRLGHANWESIKKARSEDSPFYGLKLDESEPPKSSCPGCVAGKGKRRIFKSAASRTTCSSYPIERIHSDLMGPITPASIGGASYACVFTCDHSSFAWTFFLRSKDETFGRFKQFKAVAENLVGRKIKFFHSDNGGEFKSSEFSEFLLEHGISHETSAPYTPQQNGVAERMNQTLIGGTHAMLEYSGMTKGFWAEAMGTAAHIINRVP